MRALFAALPLLLLPTLATAAERPLTGDQLRELARREMVWCENHRPAKNDCETMTLVSLLPDGTLRETGVMRLSSTPDMKLVIDGRSRLEGDRICSVYNEDSVKVGFVMNGEPMPAMATQELERLVRDAMDEFRGKTLCQTFYSDGSAERLREEVTVDGARRRDLESRYRIQADEAGLDVRATQSDAEETQA
jgi:hypothetical protein